MIGNQFPVGFEQEGGMGETSQRRIVVGDVHGHYEGLMTLLEAIAPSTADQVYFLGDLIDRGPRSSEVVQFVRESGYFCLLGNHEQLLLNALPKGQVSVSALQGWLYSGGQTTIDSYTDVETLLEHINWLETLPAYLDLGDVWLVHAGVHPRLPLAEQTTQELCWIREEFHCTPEPYFPDKLIITGHTITFTFPGVAPGQLAHGNGWLDIDTGAYHPRSGWLTGLDVNRRLVYQVNVFNEETRILPLEEVVVHLKPQDLATRHQSVRVKRTVINT